MAERPHPCGGGSLMAAPARNYTLDPVTFEVLKNAFVTTGRPDGGADPAHVPLVRPLRARLLLGALRPERRHDHAREPGHRRHVGTLHFTAKATIDAFAGRMRPGDVYAINDPYAGGTHFCDVRVVRPIFHEGAVDRLCPVERSLGGRRRQRPGLLRRQRAGALRRRPAHHARADLPRRPLLRRRRPDDRLEHAQPRRGNEGDLHSQVEATAVAERELLSGSSADTGAIPS